MQENTTAMQAYLAEVQAAAAKRGQELDRSPPHFVAVKEDGKGVIMCLSEPSQAINCDDLATALAQIVAS